MLSLFFFFQAEDGIRDDLVTGVQTCALPISSWICSPCIAYAMQGLQIQLVISLDRHETHRRPCDSLRDRLGIDVVALVRFHVRLHILRRYQSHLVSLFPQCSAKKMRTSAGFHANQPDVYVGS